MYKSMRTDYILVGENTISDDDEDRTVVVLETCIKRQGYSNAVARCKKMIEEGRYQRVYITEVRTVVERSVTIDEGDIGK